MQAEAWTCPASLDALWGSELPPHTLENVGDSEIHVIGVELKSG
jgi:hypothetical protein